MPATELSPAPRRALGRRQGGGHAVEFSIVVLVSLMLVFGILEMARALYVINTLQEVTRRAAQAAATANIGSADALAGIRQDAVFRQGSGPLLIGDPVTDRHVRIDFLALVADAAGRTTMTPVGAVSSCPQQNRLNCLNDPNGAACVRFVRARICMPGAAGDCAAAIYKPIFPMVDFPIRLPVSSTIVPVESLGYRPGAGLCS